MVSVSCFEVSFCESNVCFRGPLCFNVLSTVPRENRVSSLHKDLFEFVNKSFTYFS